MDKENPHHCFRSSEGKERVGAFGKLEGTQRRESCTEMKDTALRKRQERRRGILEIESRTIHILINNINWTPFLSMDFSNILNFYQYKLFTEWIVVLHALLQLGFYFHRFQK
ncbi:hypothetical protein D3C76_415410 [compost metagenome]